MILTDWLYEKTGQSHQIALARLFRLLYQAMTEVLLLDEKTVFTQLAADYEDSGFKGLIRFHLEKDEEIRNQRKGDSESRQKRHYTKSA